MKIVITTGIYPPDIGGPAEYAVQLFETILTQKYEVSVSTYGPLMRLPKGIRHCAYFIKLFFDAFDADYIIALDTTSVAFPSVIFAKLLGKKIVVRVAGDPLWETFVERTREHILLSDFYTKKRAYTLREKIMFYFIRFSLRSASGVVFSTRWQKDIMREPYGLDTNKIHIIENFYPTAETQYAPTPAEKVFLSPSRDRFIKNKHTLKQAFDIVTEQHSDVRLDTKVVSHEVLLEKITRAYAVVIPSFSEVSPNMVYDALRYGVPVVVTKDTGIYDRIKDLVVFIDPFSKEDIVEAVETLLDEAMYAEFKRKIILHNHSHSWNEIAQEFIDIYSTL